MQLFQGNNLMYLSFHVLGFLFCMISMLGIPGHLDKESRIIKILLKQLDLLLPLACYGIPILLLGSLGLFYVELIFVAQILSVISLSLGLGLLLTLLGLYAIKE